MAIEVDFRKSQPHEIRFGLMLGVLISMRGIEDGLPGNCFEFLREVADPEPRPLADRSFVRRLLTKDHAEEGRFPGAVRSRPNRLVNSGEDARRPQ